MGFGSFRKLIPQIAKSVKKATASKTSTPSAIGSLKGGPLKKVATAIATAAPKKSTASSSKEEDVKNLMKSLPKLMRGRRFFNEGGAVKKPVKRAGGSPPKGETVYSVLGRRVTKDQYDEASKEMDRPKSKVEEDMDDFAKQARERAKMKPKKMMIGGMADKTGRAMKKTASDAKGRAMTKAPKKMMGGGMAKYAKGGSVACGPATRGYGAARRGK